jgi:radical SAM protein with 4Fe4S-binding SPASM domain
MRLELAKACLEDALEATRKAGVVLLTEEESPEADFLLIMSMADVSEAVWQTARNVLIHRYPWLALEPSFVRPVPDSALVSWQGNAWACLRRGIKLVIREAESNPHLLKRFLTIPGVIPDVIEELQDCGQGALALEMANLAGHSSASPLTGREILMAPTYRCNLTCSYCYAKGFSKGFPADMSLEDLTIALSWAAAQGVDCISLCGGEPTTYSHFPQLLQMAKSRGMSVRLTSNCLYPVSLQEYIVTPAIRELVAHYDQERMEASQSAAEVFEKNLQAAQAGGVQMMIRYTLTEQSGPAEWGAIIDLAHRLSIQQINYGLAFRGAEGANAYFKSRDAVGAVGGRLEDLLTGFYSDAANSGLRLHLSKPFPLCALRPESLRRIFSNGTIRSACAVFRDGFSRNLTINPDLSTFPCNGIAVRGPKITEFSSFADAGRHNAQLIRDLMLRPYAEECTRCALWYRGFCQGACLAEHFWMSREEKKGQEV